VVVATTIGAAAHRDNPSRLRHLVINPAEIVTNDKSIRKMQAGETE
jgi:hypothetical protein